MVHPDECMVGEGDFDIKTYLLAVQKLPHQPPILLEHLHTKEEYEQARTYTLGLGPRGRDGSREGGGGGRRNG